MMLTAVFRFYACWCACVVATTAYAADDIKTLEQLRKESIIQVPQDRTKLESTVPNPSTVPCPGKPVVVDSFRHEIAYARTEELDPLRGLKVIHANVWERGPNTALYIREPLSEYIPTVRMVYLFNEGDIEGAFTCTLLDEWKSCVQKQVPFEEPQDQARTCGATFNLLDIPAWEPSPNSEKKRRVAAEILAEIAAQWSGAQEIVIRDFNFKDPQVTMYLKMPDGEYVQGCAFHAATQPHCVGWHSFGMAPSPNIRKWVFKRPYRLR